MNARAAPENEVIKRAVNGDRSALTELFECHGPAIRPSIAKRIPRRWQALLSADDVMQQTYADAFRDIGRFVGTSQPSFAAWLARLARCNFQDAIRGLEADKRSPEQNPVRGDQTGESPMGLLDLLSNPAATPSEICARDENGSFLNRAIERLPKDYRDVVRMCYLEGKSVEQVAEIMNRSLGAVFMLLARAHRKLREMLGPASDFI